jgi:spore germination protein YaaH
MLGCLAATTHAGAARPPHAARPATSRSELWGFVAPWDPRSAATVARHGDALSVAISGWMRLDTTSALPTPAYRDTIRVPLGTRRFLLVTTYARDRFHPEIIRRLGDDPALRARAAANIAAWAGRHGYRGIVLDFESLAPADTTALSAVVKAIADAAHRQRIRPVTVAVPPADTLTYAARRLRSADLLLAMLYDEHWSTGTPGPIASPDWVQRLIAPWVTAAGVSRIVAALPVYGYLWKPPNPATVLSFADAQRDAAVVGATWIRDSASLALHYARPDSAQGWVTDAALLDTLMRQTRATGVRRFALWRLGLEDPAIWRRKGSN